MKVLVELQYTVASRRIGGMFERWSTGTRTGM